MRRVYDSSTGLGEKTRRELKYCHSGSDTIYAKILSNSTSQGGIVEPKFDFLAVNLVKVYRSNKKFITGK